MYKQKSKNNASEEEEGRQGRQGHRKKEGYYGSSKTTCW
jgi:hypothetical protein